MGYIRWNLEESTKPIILQWNGRKIPRNPKLVWQLLTVPVFVELFGFIVSQFVLLYEIIIILYNCSCTAAGKGIRHILVFIMEWCVSLCVRFYFLAG